MFLFSAFKAVSVIGGLDITEDRKKVQGAKAVVGTPGRVLHLIKNDILNTSKIRLLVLDEADKLLTESFRSDLEKIIKSLPSKKQIIACSATFCNDLDRELATYMRNPLLISTEKRATLLIGIKQFVYELPEEVNSILEMNGKVEVLNKIFSKISFKQCLAFASSQSRAESYKNILKKNDWPCEVISGAQDQKTRLEIFKKFREFKTRILFSTDLMSRGIDSENVNLVINIEVPDSSSTYLHRIGRAGRFGSHGIAITFLCSNKDKAKFSKILNEIGDYMAVLKFPKDDIPDLWDFSNLNEEQKAFGLFERICTVEIPNEIENKKDVEDNRKTEKAENQHENDSGNLKIPTDSISSSSQKQNSINATTLDDASSLAVDSDIHLDGSSAPINNCVPNEKKSLPSKSKRSKSKEQKKKSQNKYHEAIIEIQINENCEHQKSNKKVTPNKQKSEKMKQSTEKNKDENVKEDNENSKNLKDESNESQSDVGNSSGGDTRTIIDFKSLVVDKNKTEVKTPTNDIFADYETFKEKPLGNESKSDSLVIDKEQNIQKASSNIFDDYEAFNEKPSENEGEVETNKKESTTQLPSNIFDDYDNFKNNKNSINESNSKQSIEIPLISASTSKQCESILEFSDVKNDDKSVSSQNFPKAPNPSPKDLQPESIRNFNQIEMNKLQIQNLPSFNLPPRSNHPDLDTSNDGDDDVEDYTSTSSSSEMVTRSSGFDERTTSLGSSGIVTSSEEDDDEYAESQESYYTTSEDNDDDDENEDDGDDEYFKTTSDSEENSSSSTDPMDQYSIDDESGNVGNKKKQKQRKFKTKNFKSKENKAEVTENNQEHSDDVNYRYQRAYALWSNIYWNQLTQIRDYVNFSTYVRKSAALN